MFIIVKLSLVSDVMTIGQLLAQKSPHATLLAVRTTVTL